MTTNPIARILLIGVILELTLATALIHLSLGGMLFALNGLGFVGLGAAYAIAVVGPAPLIQRFGWLPRLGLAAYAAATIGAYLVIGPYFTLGWVTKAIELAIVGLVLADLLATYGSPTRLVRAAMSSLAPPRAHGRT
jgi:hypothetical protein